MPLSFWLIYKFNVHICLPGFAQYVVINLSMALALPSLFIKVVKTCHVNIQHIRVIDWLVDTLLNINMNFLKSLLLFYCINYTLKVIVVVSVYITYQNVFYVTYFIGIQTKISETQFHTWYAIQLGSSWWEMPLVQTVFFLLSLVI